MLTLEPQFFGLTFQTFFSRPVLFPKSGVLAAAEDIAQALQPLGVMKASQLQLNKRDEIFNYDLSLSIFNGNGSFSLNSERMEVTFSNGRSREDLSLITRCLLTFHEAAHLPQGRLAVFNAHVHGKPGSENDTAAYFADYATHGATFKIRGLIANVRVPTWAEEFRVYIEQSTLVPAGMFLDWSTNLPGGAISEAVLEHFLKSIEATSAVAGISFTPLK